MPIRRQLRRLLGASAVLALTCGALIAPATPARAAAPPECATSIYGVQAGKLVYRSYGSSGAHGTDPSDAGVTPTKLSFTPISFTGRSGGAGDPGYWQNDYYVPSTDGKLRAVTVEHWVGKTTMKVTVNQVVASGFKPSLVSIDGDSGDVVTSNSSGVVDIRKLTGRYGAKKLGAPVRLPVKLTSPSTLAARHVGNSLRIYATSKATADLTEIIVPDNHPEQAKAYRIASSGHGSSTDLVAGWCWGNQVHDVALIAVNRVSGNAVTYRHVYSLNHAASLTAKVYVGTNGGWKSWSGIGD